MLQRLSDIDRSIVCAAMSAANFEKVGEFGRIDGEEYGHYVFWQDDLETIMVCSLDEDAGDIEIGTIEDFSKHPHLESITKAIDPTN